MNGPMAHLRVLDRNGRLNSAELALDRAQRSLEAARAEVQRAKLTPVVGSPHACFGGVDAALEMVAGHGEVVRMLAREADALLPEVLE